MAQCPADLCTLPLQTRKVSFPLVEGMASWCVHPHHLASRHTSGEIVEDGPEIWSIQIMLYWIENPLCFTYSIVSILWPGRACPSCLACVEGARRCCHYRPYGRKLAERGSVGCVNTVGRSSKWEETLHLSCLESHFDFAIKMCKSSPHRPVVETDYTSLQTYLDCSLSWFEPTLRGRLFLGKIHRNLSIWRLLERRQERSLF